VTARTSITQLNAVLNMVNPEKALAERPVEGPELKLQRTFSFSGDDLLDDSRAIENDEGVVAFDVGA
jgi:hypothetical protein